MTYTHVIYTPDATNSYGHTLLLCDSAGEAARHAKARAKAGFPSYVGKFTTVYEVPEPEVVGRQLDLDLPPAA